MTCLDRRGIDCVVDGDDAGQLPEAVCRMLGLIRSMPERGMTAIMFDVGSVERSFPAAIRRYRAGEARRRVPDPSPAWRSRCHA